MDKDIDQPLYTVSVAARLVECHPQTLRQYEDAGLLTPTRTTTNIRRYSDRDIERARRIRRFTLMGVNLAGVEIIVELLNRMENMHQEMEREIANTIREMQAEIDRWRDRAQTNTPEP